MEPNKLAMGQTYEQLDQGIARSLTQSLTHSLTHSLTISLVISGVEGRLGPRGSEDAPVQFNFWSAADGINKERKEIVHEKLIIQNKKLIECFW